MRREPAGPSTASLLVIAAIVAVSSGTATVGAGTDVPPVVTAEAGAGASISTETAIEERRIVVYYFHGERRCRTCRAIESKTHDVVRTRFAEQLQAGSLSWEVVNYDEPQNDHFIRDFGLVSASVVLVEMNGDETVRYEVLQKTWSLVRDETRFEHYVRHAITEFLG
jgi:hypothetical protein